MDPVAEGSGSESASLTHFGEHFRHQIFRNAQFPLITYWIQMRRGRPSTMALSKPFEIETRCRRTSAKSHWIAHAVTPPLSDFLTALKPVCWRNSRTETCLDAVSPGGHLQLPAGPHKGE